jgi:molybdenum cofactor biosynthesis enzyme MoaA
MKTAQYVIVCIYDRCDSNCTLCLLDGQKGDLRLVSLEEFKVLLPLYTEKYKGVIFSGAEVTLNKQLPEFVSYAKSLGFRNIRIQTNGRRLSDLRKVRQLQLAGVNEFFVSFHAAQETISKKITRRASALHETIQALENLDRSGLKVITNTVMVSLNYKTLPQIVRFLLKFKNIKAMEFWGYVPMSSDRGELMLPYVLAAPYLNEALKILRDKRREARVKYFPTCLLTGDHKKYLDNDQPVHLKMTKDAFRSKWRACDFQKCEACEDEYCKGLPVIYRQSDEFEIMKKGKEAGYGYHHQAPI